MDEITKLLIIGVILGVLLLTIGLIIYIYIRRKKKNAEVAEVEGDEVTLIPYSNDDFTIPMKSYTVKGQVPTISNQKDLSENNFFLNKEDYPQLNAEPIFVPRFRKLSSVSHCSTSSLPLQGITEENDAISEEGSSEAWEEDSKEDVENTYRRRNTAPPELKRYKSTWSLTQQSISKGMMDELEVKRRCSATLDENQIRRISVYDSTTIDVGRRTLARRRGEITAPRKSYKKVGMIHFSTQYSDETCELEVFIMRASDIAAKREESKVNTFVRLYLSPFKKQRQDTKLVFKNKNPFYQERIVFKEMRQEELRYHKLKLKLYNRDKLFKNELLGQVDILLSSVNLERRENFDIYLFKQRSPIANTSVSISLSHLATCSKLEVFIDDLKKLPKKKFNSAIYGSVTLFKENISIRKYTAVKYHNKDVTFGESLVFDVITNSSIPLSTFSLVFSLIERSLIRPDEVLGHVIFGLSSPQTSAIKHWMDVQFGPHEKHTYRHNLVDPDEL